MKLCLVNIDFIDAYTGKLNKAGSKIEMTPERVTEVKAVNPEFISVIGEVATKDTKDTKKTKDKPE